MFGSELQANGNEICAGMFSVDMALWKITIQGPCWKEDIRCTYVMTNTFDSIYVCMCVCMHGCMYVWCHDTNWTWSSPPCSCFSSDAVDIPVEIDHSRSGEGPLQVPERKQASPAEVLFCFSFFPTTEIQSAEKERERDRERERDICGLRSCRKPGTYRRAQPRHPDGVHTGRGMLQLGKAYL